MIEQVFKIKKVETAPFDEDSNAAMVFLEAIHQDGTWLGSGEIIIVAPADSMPEIVPGRTLRMSVQLDPAPRKVMPGGPGGDL